MQADDKGPRRAIRHCIEERDMHQAPGTREAENENLMRNKLRALNWFGLTLSDDLWDFASKQCAFNPNCGKTTVHPVRPRLMQRRVGV